VYVALYPHPEVGGFTATGDKKVNLFKGLTFYLDPTKQLDMHIHAAHVLINKYNILKAKEYEKLTI